MRHEKIEAGSCDASPNENCVSTAQPYSKNAPKTQRPIPAMPENKSGVSDWRKQLVAMGFFDSVLVVIGELGPIEVLGSPMVVVAVRGCSTFVWVERQPWGWADASREFLKANSKAAHRYAVELATKLRDEALREAARRDRRAQAKLNERAAVLRSRGGGL